MKVNRKELTDLLRCLKPGIDKNSVNISGMDCFIFIDGRIYSHDDVVSISVPSPLEGEFAISAVEFYEILSKFKGEIVEVTIEENGLALKCGRAKAKITFRKDDVSKRIRSIAPKDSDWKELSTPNMAEVLASTFVKVTNAADLNRIGGICIKEGTVLSSDNSVIARTTLSEFLDTMWLSPRVVHILSGVEGLTHYCVINSWVHFKSNLMQVSARKLSEASYPFNQYKEVMSAVEKLEINGTFTKEFIATIGRAAIFAKEKDGDFVLDLTFSENSIIVSSESGSGSFEETIDSLVYAPTAARACLSAVRLKHALEKWENIDFFLGKLGDGFVLVLTKGSYTEMMMLYKE